MLAATHRTKEAINVHIYTQTHGRQVFFGGDAVISPHRPRAIQRSARDHRKLEFHTRMVCYKRIFVIVDSVAGAYIGCGNGSAASEVDRKAAFARRRDDVMSLIPHSDERDGRSVDAEIQCAYSNLRQ